MYISHHLWEHGIGGEKSPPLPFVYFLLCAASISWNYPMLNCLVNLVKLSNAQLPRQSRETIRCSAASSVSWNYPMLNCLVKSRETIRCSAASSISWNYTMLSQKSRRHQEHTAKTQIFPEMKLQGLVPNSYIHVSVTDLYIPTIGLLILLQQNRWTAIIRERSNMKRNLIKMVNIRINPMLNWYRLTLTFFFVGQFI
jgi:hypothetical protein